MAQAGKPSNYFVSIKFTKGIELPMEQRAIKKEEISRYIYIYINIAVGHINIWYFDNFSFASYCIFVTHVYRS